MAAAGMKDLSLEAHKINLRAGDTHQLKLGGLGSAGYAWDYAIEGDTGIVAISIESLPPPPRPSPGGPPPDSYSTEELLSITALAPGVIKVRLIMRRSWERDKLPLREIFLEISVSQ